MLLTIREPGFANPIIRWWRRNRGRTPDIPYSASGGSGKGAQVAEKDAEKSGLRNEWKSIRICRYYRLDLTN